MQTSVLKAEDINNQNPAADRLINPGCIFKWVQAELSVERRETNLETAGAGGSYTYAFTSLPFFVLRTSFYIVIHVICAYFFA